MSRLTEYREDLKRYEYKRDCKGYCFLCEGQILNKLGQFEDLMEKYEIKSIEELEEILKDYDDMAKDIVEMATGRKVDIKQ